MSKSLEALENLVHCKSETKCKECKHKYRCTMERDYNTIKQDLERLEQLEKENQELKDKGKELVKDFHKAIDILKKYKKAIDILKDRLTIEFDDKYNEINFEVSGSTEIDYVYLPFDDKQEYELLKEILEDDK
jgi:predicted RNase H-like nuclease (RuvC/YqgF family)